MPVRHAIIALLSPMALSIFVFPTTYCDAADLLEARQLYQSGRYVECTQYVAAAIEETYLSENWAVLKVQAEMASGQYTQAQKSLDAALEKLSYSIRLRWLGRDVCRRNGQEERAQTLVEEIAERVRQSAYRYRNPADQLALAEMLISLNIDPKRILDEALTPITRQNPNFADGFVAVANLALDKQDFAMAADFFAKAAEKDPQNPEPQFGLARAFAPSDSQRANQALATTLELNPNYVPALLWIADKKIDAEDYTTAAATLDQILSIDGHQSSAWAYRAVLALLDHRLDEAEGHRQKALSTWSANAEVPFLIGKKLSQKYRFAEGAQFQRDALKLNANYVPARLQLSQDLLRLGEEQEGWELANAVYEADGYSVIAHNLVTLHDELDGFDILSRDGFVVRMSPREARIYGELVLDLLVNAKETLCQKYDAKLVEPIYVEIFPRQQDFAIRTFGLPGGAGFLGVCFGRVITMNSPASQGESPSNWKSVLWHEFCHVVTLHKTNNKMPRWLSEGISVYEERLANRAWGEQLIPTYREMILGEDLTPVSQLSGAFLDPSSPLHLQFAYYESSLVVEYLIETYGLDVLKRILTDLGAGMPINESLQRYTGSLPVLDDEFAAFARQRAEQLAPQVDWQQPDLPTSASLAEWETWSGEHPHAYRGLQVLARKQIAGEQWDAARSTLEQMIELFSEHAEAGCAYEMLATLENKVGNMDAEQAAWRALAERTDDHLVCLQRLIEIDRQRADWAQLVEDVELFLAVNPLIPAPHRALAEAAEATHDDRLAIRALEVLDVLGPLDVAENHLRLAQALDRVGEMDAAKRHVLQALEEAPRYQAAQKLLLKLIDTPSDSTIDDTADRESASDDTPQSLPLTSSPPAETEAE
ncbi:MAG: peptidase MA family metallohydrolase [Pirellulaceae bacterium]|nr:hypothetical protein [Planctomycetales bacterium]